jgi:alkylation response protein AidB-like acyl-CoA dehydrogenase
MQQAETSTPQSLGEAGSFSDPASFRQAVRTWLEENCPPSMRSPLRSEAEVCWGGRNFQFQSEDQRLWLERMAARGWTAPTWPREYGGGGLDRERAKVLKEELDRIHARPPLLSFGISMLGPALLKFGSEEQKLQHLPPVVRGEIRWAQGYSEPNAGSDLASLQARCEDRGDHFVLNGSKIWTSYGDFADWMFCLVRTDSSGKPQAGISYLLIDMKTPGITIRPIPTIDGEHHFNEVFFDDVRVPVANLIGQENKGWTYAKYLLGNERIGIARVGASKQRVQKAKELAAAVMIGDTPLSETERFREKLAALEVELKALEITQMRVVANARSLPPGVQDPASSILKLKGSELQQAATEILMEIAGAYAMALQPEHLRGEATEEPIGSEWAATVAADYFYTRAASIYGGSNEIQKNVIAKRILGL